MLPAGSILRYDWAMTIPAFLHDKSVQGAIFVFVLGAAFVMAQIKVARQQLFASLADKRQKWYEEFKRVISARTQEINEQSRDQILMMQGAPALSRFWQLRDDAIWLFGPEIDRSLERIENNLKLQFETQASFHESKAVNLNPDTANFQMKWMHNQTARTDLEAGLRYEINPYLYVGDVRRGWLWVRTTKARLRARWEIVTTWVKSKVGR